MNIDKRIKARLKAYFGAKSIRQQILLSLLLVSVSATVVLAIFYFIFPRIQLKKL